MDEEVPSNVTGAVAEMSCKHAWKGHVLHFGKTKCPRAECSCGDRRNYYAVGPWHNVKSPRRLIRPKTW